MKISPGGTWKCTRRHRLGLCISCSSLPGRVNWESDHSWSCCPVLSGPSSGRPGGLTAYRPSGNFLPRPSIPSPHPAGGEGRCTAQGPGPTPGTQNFLITFPSHQGLDDSHSSLGGNAPIHPVPTSAPSLPLRVLKTKD